MKAFILPGVFLIPLLFCHAVFGITITGTLDTTAPPANAAYTATTGTQTGRLTRNGVPSLCAAPKANPGLGGITTGARRYDAYVFTAPTSGCASVTLNTAGDLFTMAYNNAGLVPANPSTNYLADPGLSPATGTATYYFSVTAGQQFTVVVHEVNVGLGNGVNYTLAVDMPATVATTLDLTAPPASFDYTAATATQTGRLGRDGIVSNCGTQKTNPGLGAATGSRQHDVYVFTAPTSGCVFVTLTGSFNLFSAAYSAGGFVPADPSLNYLADMGASFAQTKTYSFRAAAGVPFTVVVHEVNVGMGVGTNYTLNVSLPLATRPAFDYDADGASDVSIFRPSLGDWYIQQSQLGVFGIRFGNSTDKIAPADYDGDGRTDIAVYRPSAGTWFISNSSSGTVSFPVFGLAEDLPAPADYDGDGKADICVFRPSTGTWFRQNSSNGTFSGIQFGSNGDKPTVGDFDGDGKADIAVWRPSNGDWYHIRSSNGTVFGERFGLSTDKIVPADYDGDGKTDIAVYRPSTGTWFIRNSGGLNFYSSFNFGLSADIPAPGDFDGDGKADLCVFRPSEGNWYRQNSSNGSFLAVPFGLSGDKPTESAFH